MLDQARHASGRRLPRQTLGEIVEEFELAWNLHGNAEVVDFLPPSDDPALERIALELFRVDLERRWRTGHAKPVEEYVRQFPTLLTGSDLVERLAYEEYRLLRAHGHPVKPSDYARRLNVTTAHWPRVSATKTARDSTPLIVRVADELERGASAMESLPGIGDHFLDFELVELLGQGKFGDVYLARQPDLANRLVVLKITTELWCESDRLARLRHTNIVPIYSVHQQGKLQAVCMPYFGRHTLHDVLKSAGDRARITASDVVNVIAPAADVERSRNESATYPSHRLLDQLRSLSFEHLCLWILSRIAAGLSHAHDRGILHRDLKPANILLTDDGQPMILDFNLAERISSQRVMVVGGTLPYMAPEHLRAMADGSRVDARSDLYSLGVMLFQMLTGRMPFSVRESMDLAGLQAMIEERSVLPVAPSSLNPRVPPAIDEIVKRCLEPEPERRYRTAEMLHQDLEHQLTHQPLRHAANRSIVELATKWIRRHPRAAAAVGVLTVSVATLAVVGMLLSRSNDRVAHLVAADRYEQFFSHVQEARPTLFTLDQQELIDLALDHVDQALGCYDVHSGNWQQNPTFQLLDEEQQRHARTAVQELFYLMAAEALHRSGRVEKTEQKTRLLQRALRHNQIALRMSTDGRDSPGIVRQQAMIQASLGHADQAARLSLRAESLSTHDRLDNFLIVLERMRARKYGQAVDLLLQLDRAWPRDFTVWYLLGKCHYGLGDMPEAAACFVTCSRLSPDSSTAYFQLGKCHWQQQDYNAAERAFAQACRFNKKEPVFLINRAMARMKQERLDEAIGDLTYAIELGRDDSLPYLLRYRAQTAARDLDQAKQSLELGLQRTPIDARGFNLRGVERLRQKKDVEGALADFESALIIDPHSRHALQNQAYVLWKELGRFEDAIAALDRILEIYPDNWETRMKRVLLRATSGKRDEAIREARALITAAETKLRPAELAEVYYYVACSFAQTSTHADDAQIADSDAREALKWLGIALEIDRKWANIAQFDIDFQPVAAHQDFQPLLDAANALSELVDRIAPAPTAGN